LVAVETVRLNAGADAALDLGGTRWDADRDVQGGQTVRRDGLAINGTDADQLYQTERYGPMTYRLGVADGTYEVRLHFAETYLDAPGARVFDVAVEGRRIEGLDVVARAGGPRRAHVEAVTVRVSDGQLRIAFEADVQQPFVNAIEVEPLDVAVLPLTPGPSRALNGEAFGYNIDATIRGVDRDDPAYTAALAGLAPGTIRFPGGTISNYWDWEEGDFVCDGIASTLRLADGTTRECSLPNGYQSLNPSRHTLDAFAAEIEATGATPAFVANMLTKRVGQTETNLDNTLRMLREARALGLAVRYLELGNEFYLNKGTRDAPSDYAVVFPSVASYVDEVGRWVRPLRREFPGLQIAAVGADRPNESSRRRAWNDSLATLLDALPNDARPDAITFHPYVGGTTDIPTLLSFGQRKGDNLTRYRFARLPRHYDIWLTEYNMFSSNAPVHGTWAHGLLTASLTLNFLDDERVTLLHAHSAIGNAVFGSLFRNTSGFDFGDSRFPSPAEGPETTVRFGRTASGIALQLVAEAMRGATTAAPLDFGPDVPKLPGDWDAVEGWAFGADRAVLLNLGDSTVNVDVSRFEGRPFVLLRAAPLDRPDGSDSVVRERRGRAGAVLRVPPYSAVRFGG
jgi:hypothetical protein